MATQVKNWTLELRLHRFRDKACTHLRFQFDIVEVCESTTQSIE